VTSPLVHLSTESRRARFIPFLSIAFAVLTILLSLAIVSCAKRDRPSGPHSSASGVPSEIVVDEALLAYLSTARALHHEADLYEDKNDVPGAIGALERLLSKTPPRRAPEVDEVIADTRARLAELRAELGDYDGGQKDVELGLAAAPTVSYFRGHLLEVRGLIEEKRGKALAAKGDTVGASKAKELAMKAYEEAIVVQDQVIERGTRDGGPK
jgi:tetratricopeptide (TPR) repeat protein